MSDSPPARSSDTIAVRAALVFPDDPTPDMGHDALRVPVKIVWRTAEPEVPIAPPLGAGGTAEGSDARSLNAMRRVAAAGDDPASAGPLGFGTEQVPRPRPPSTDPVGTFLRVNEALDGATKPGIASRRGVGVTNGNLEDSQDPAGPVPVVDDRGMPILGARGPMVRPASLPPEFFISKGLNDRKVIESLIASGEGGAPAALGYQAGRLAHFRQGGAWDAQRVGGVFNDQFVDYATVAIGLYAAAAGISEGDIPSIENMYASISSDFGSATVRVQRSTSLAERNVKNTHIGYEVYNANRVRDLDAK